MGVLTVRGLDDTLIKALRARAAKNGRSAEAEHRSILEQALLDRATSFKVLARRRRRSLMDRNFLDSATIIRKFREGDLM